MERHMWSRGIHHQIWTSGLEKEVVFLKNIARLSIPFILRTYQGGYASKIETGADWEGFFQMKGANHGDESTYYRGDQALDQGTSFFVNEDWYLPQRMDEDKEKWYHILNM